MKNNNVILRGVFLVLSIIVAITIFIFSSQNAKQSSAVSRGLIRKVIEILPKTKNLSETEKQKIVKKSQKYVRKLAHFSIYTLLGINIILFFKTFLLMERKQCLFTLVICLIYAISDEIHQFFSDGRTPLVIDVCIDMFGSLLGVGFVELVSYWYRRLKNNEPREKLT